MILPDVNVLIYAFRADSTRHAVCKRWPDGIVLGDVQFGLSPLASSAVARFATNPRIFTQPSSLEETSLFVTICWDSRIAIRFARVRVIGPYSP